MADPDKNLKELQGRFRDIRARHERGDKVRHATQFFKKWGILVALLLVIIAAAYWAGPDMLEEWLSRDD